MGDQTDNAFEVPQAGVLINETAGVYAGSGTPELVAPDAPLGSLFLTSGGTRYTRTADTGSGVASDWTFEDPHATGGGASVQLSWRFSTTTTAADPGSKRLRYNDATPANVTELYIDDITNSNGDASGLLNLLQPGNKMYLQQSNDATAFLLATVVTVTDETGWFTIVVTIDDSGTLPDNNSDIGVILAYGAGGGAAAIASKAITIEAPTASEDLSMFFTERAITITEMRAVIRGTTPSLTWTIRHATDRSAAGTEVVTGGTTTTSQTTGDDVTSFDDATIPADSFVWLETTARTPVVDEMSVTIVYGID